MFSFSKIRENDFANSQNATRIILGFGTEGGYICNSQQVDFDAQKQFRIDILGLYV